MTICFLAGGCIPDPSPDIPERTHKANEAGPPLAFARPLDQIHRLQFTDRTDAHRHPSMNVDRSKAATSMPWSAVENGGLALVSFASLIIFSRFD